MMFKKAIALFSAGIMAAGLFAGTGSIGVIAAENATVTQAKESTAEETAVTQAKEIALKDAGLKETEVTFDRVEMGTEQGASVYEIEFKTTEVEYDYDIAIADGEIVKESWEIRHPAASGSQISQAQAREIALKDAGVIEKDATFARDKDGFEDGVAVYEIEFENATTEFDYDVAKAGGKILSASRKVKVPASVAAQQKAAGAQTSKTGTEAAIEVALKHAGLTEDSVTSLRCGKDRDNGRDIYEVEFRYGGYEYEYDIDAGDYSIIEWDKDYDD